MMSDLQNVFMPWVGVPNTPTLMKSHRTHVE
jgi:hypothetical protein